MKAFIEHVDVTRLLEDLRKHDSGAWPSASSIPAKRDSARMSTSASYNDEISTEDVSKQPRRRKTRKEVEDEAARAGASGG